MNGSKTMHIDIFAPEPQKMTRTFFFMIVSIFVCSNAHLFSNVRSISNLNKINFDVNSDGLMEATLNRSGLAIGSNNAAANLYVNGNAIISNTLTIGSSSLNSSSNLFIQGSYSMGPQLTSTNVNLNSQNSSSIVLVDTSSGNVSLQLPYAGNVRGRFLTIKKSSPNHDLWIWASGNYLDKRGAALYRSAVSGVLPTLSAISNGSNWYILSSVGETRLAAESNLLGHWTFDQTSGSNIVESVTGSANGVLNASAVFSGGFLNQALSLNGTEEIYLTNNSAYSPSNGSFTITCWIKRNGVQASKTGIMNIRNGSSFYYFYIGENGNPRAEIRDASSNSVAITSNTTTPDSVWTHLTYIMDRTAGSVSRFYINGTFNTELSHPTLTDVIDTTGAAKITIGRNTPTYQALNGDLDDLRYYNKALTNVEVREIFIEGSGNID